MLDTVCLALVAYNVLYVLLLIIKLNAQQVQLVKAVLSLIV